MPREIRIKRGDVLLLNCLFLEQDAPVDLSTATLSAQVRGTVSDLVATLPIVTTTTPGQATIQYPNTGDWPVGTLRCDIKVTIAGMVTHTETIGIHVDRAVTQ